MCGICGYISKKDLEEISLMQMRDTIIYRGPDDAGQEISKIGEYSVGMAHRRLSIVDLSENGHQPMSSLGGGKSVIFNGEIYNYEELREELKGYPYQSKTDTEIILAAYEQWGIDFVNRCNGMFAIALLDKDKKTLYLIRDRMGQKPLYYYYDGSMVIFASALKPIMAYPDLHLEIDKSVLGRYLVKQCIVSPNTIYKNVYKVSPGEMITVKIIEDKKLELKKKKYWEINKFYLHNKNSFKGSYEDAKQQLKKALIKSIDYRMMADVPVGLLLSGGYDSSIIAALAQKKRTDKIKTYSIGIKDSTLDEACFAKDIADYIGTDHHELYISKDEMLDMVRKLPEYYDEPFADSSQIATMLVARLARQDVTVVLTGDGGDELFGGYPIYAEERMAQKLDFVGGILYKLKEKKIIFRYYNKLPFAIKMIVENRKKENKTQFNYRAKIDTARMILGEKEGISENYDESKILVKSWSTKRMLLDAQTYLPDDLFCKVDRATMMNSLEARSPFMDRNVVELALAMPQRFKLNRRKGKRIIKDIAWELIPKKMLDRPKSGFEVPIDDWMRNELKEKLVDCSRQEYLEKQGIFRPLETEKLVDRYLNNDVNRKRGQKINTIIWSFFIFQMWYEKYKVNF